MFLNLKCQLLLILFLAIFNCTQAQKQQTDLSKMSLLGQVQTVSHIEYRLNQDNVFVQENSSLVRFNTEGYTLQIKQYNKDLRLNYRTIFEYDKKGHLVQSKKYAIHKSLDSSLVSQDTLTYNTAEKTIVLTHYDSRETVKAKTILTEEARELISYAPDGTVMIRIIQQLNKRGKPISEEKYIVNNVFREKRTWKYFNKKILIKKYDKEGKFLYNSIHKLDARGNIISWNPLNSKERNAYKYKYDKKNNWIQKITYRNEALVSKIERKIVYY